MEEKRMKSVNGETPLPEAMIQYIQSFLSVKEAARSTLLSKSWYNAWLTRPSIDLDYRNFDRKSSYKFRDFAKKTMQRYQDLNLKIESFKLCVEEDIYRTYADNLIVNAIKIGATRLQLELPDSVPLKFALSECHSHSFEELSVKFHSSSSTSSLILPVELLGSQNLLRLSLSRGLIDGKHVISCSALKCLTLLNVTFTNIDMLNDIITRCISMEELSLSCCHGIRLKAPNMYELHKLRRLFLHYVNVDTMFFTDFASRFPFLKDLSIRNCLSCTIIQIASTSLQTISFEPVEGSWRAEFDVPNIRKFTYSGTCLPSHKLSIKDTASRKWDFDISISSNKFYRRFWFLKLKKYLTKYRPLSRISLSINLNANESEHEVDAYFVVPKPLVVENLMIDAPSEYCCALLVSLFEICRPKFITHDWLCHDWRCRNASLDILCKRFITPESGIPDQSMFGQFNLKKVNVEVYEMFDTEWRPLLLEEPLDATKTPVNERRVRFELIWVD